MDMDDDDEETTTDIREQMFHNTVREHIVSLLGHGVYETSIFFF